MSADIDIKVFLILAGVALVIGLIIYSFVAAAERRKALLAWCQSNGLEFDPERSEDPGAGDSQVSVMQEGHDRYGENWCTGQWQGRALCCFDYHYTTGSGKSQSSHSLSMMTIASPSPLKSLIIRPEGFLDKVGEFFGAQEIHFESAEFNRRYHVWCEDRKWAYDALPPRALELLLSDPRRLHVQFDRQTVVFWDGEVWSPENIGRAARTASGLMDVMPRFAVQEAME